MIGDNIAQALIKARRIHNIKIALSLLFGAFGLGILLFVSWPIALGVFLMLWGNNMQAKLQ